MFTFATDYFILVFVASVGVIQVAASIGGLNGLLIFKSRYIARTLGLSLALAAFIWFFVTGERNINDHAGGLDANSQALFFFLGVLCAGAFTFLLTSIVNSGMNGSEPLPDEGLDALKETSYLRAVAYNIGYWRRNWRTQIKRYFSG